MSLRLSKLAVMVPAIVKPGTLKIETVWAGTVQLYVSPALAAAVRWHVTRVNKTFLGSLQ